MTGSRPERHPTAPGPKDGGAPAGPATNGVNGQPRDEARGVPRADRRWPHPPSRHPYGISKDNNEDLRELASFGLIHLVGDDDRNMRDGTMREFRLRGNDIFHRIAVLPDGEANPADPTVLRGLRDLQVLMGQVCDC